MFEYENSFQEFRSVNNDFTWEGRFIAKYFGARYNNCFSLSCHCQLSISLSSTRPVTAIWIALVKQSKIHQRMWTVYCYCTQSRFPNWHTERETLLYGNVAPIIHWYFVHLVGCKSPIIHWLSPVKMRCSWLFIDFLPSFQFVFKKWGVFFSPIPDYPLTQIELILCRIN